VAATDDGTGATVAGADGDGTTTEAGADGEATGTEEEPLAATEETEAAEERDWASVTGQMVV